MATFLHQLLAGLANGGIYACLALALVMFFQATHHINFAQGEQAMFSAYVALVLPFSIWVLRGFFIIVPVEIEEAAAIDGAGTWRILWSVLFPLVLPPSQQAPCQSGGHDGAPPICRKSASDGRRIAAAPVCGC